MGPRGPEARAHLSGPTQMGKLRRCAEDAASGGEHGGAAPNKSCFFEHRAAGLVADYSRVSKTVWPSGLRRWLKAPVRKGVGSNPTAVITKSASGVQVSSLPQSQRGGLPACSSMAMLVSPMFANRVRCSRTCRWRVPIVRVVGIAERGFDPRTVG